jgi:hypothetical protein
VDDTIVSPREVALALALHLDDVGPQIGEVAGRQRCCDSLLKSDNTDTVEGKN